jgi:peroxiredoxin Q/BCP
MALSVGDPAPGIHLKDDSGADFDLSSLKGKTVVLFFYPKADTPGCTKESCEFRDHRAAFAEKNAVVLGISPDPVKAQSKFQAKFGFGFPLLADEDHAVAEAYGVWKEKSMYGKQYMGVERTTFVIGPDGNIAKIYEKVKPEGHAEAVLGEL